MHFKILKVIGGAFQYFSGFFAVAGFYNQVGPFVHDEGEEGYRAGRHLSASFASSLMRLCG